MHVVFWQNIVSPHQAAFVRALAHRGHSVDFVSAAELTPDRQATGWSVPALAGVRVQTNPSEASVTALVRGSSPETIHVMAGARLTPLGPKATRLIVSRGARIGLLTEAPDPRGISGVLRWVKYALERFKVGRSYDFVLAMGDLGCRWFRRCGYPSSRVLPFAYTVDPVAAHEIGVRPPGDPFRVLFVGRLVALKGLEDLLTAFRQLEGLSVDFAIVGDGPERPRLEALSSGLPRDVRVSWSPTLPNLDARLRMEHADLLVLPSRKDGWGAVVNEALTAGTPVLCSDACGAADLIQEDWLGTVFRAANVTSLETALRDRIKRGPVSAMDRRRIREWSEKISGTSLAVYFESAMAHFFDEGPRPVAPWRFRG